MFSKPNTVVYLRRDDIIIGGKKINPGRLSISQELASNLEIINIEKFMQTCQNFFETNGLSKKKVLLVLDSSVVFSKSITLEDAKARGIYSLLESFMQKMPIQKGNRALIGYQIDDTLKIYGTNSQLYDSVVDSLQDVGIKKIVAITPSDAYSLDFNAKSEVIINGLLTDKTIRKKINFSTITPN